ncbi:hypothetical protein [Natrinema amylolyticum]|uniref:hypothetical protein n=1 Tax=Natrinema amylolyticum TaxID=2878679 RepID=UPI001CFB7541|nr:hypothetical protein [Natrinema amylolyticum]
MARDAPGQNGTETERKLPNLVTIVGRGVPSNYEITVDGEIEMMNADHREEATIISGGTVEGSIEVGVQRYRFSGQMANVRLVDWNGIEAPDSPSTPAVNIEYGAAKR